MATTTRQPPQRKRAGRPKLELTREQERKLENVLRAANRLEAARAALREAALEATDAGVPKRTVAEAADLSERGIYRLLARERDGRDPSDAHTG